MAKLTEEEVKTYMETVKGIASRALEINEHNLLQDCSALLRRLESYLVPQKANKEGK